MDYNMENAHADIAKNHGKPNVVFMVANSGNVETRHFTKGETTRHSNTNFRKYKPTSALRTTTLRFAFAGKPTGTKTARHLPRASASRDKPCTRQRKTCTRKETESPQSLVAEMKANSSLRQLFHGRSGFQLRNFPFHLRLFIKTPFLFESSRAFIRFSFSQL